MFDLQVVEHTRDDEVDEIANARRTVVEPWRCRNDQCARARDLCKIVQVNEGQRRFARNNNQAPSLLERDIGRTFDQ